MSRIRVKLHPRLSYAAQYGQQLWWVPSLRQASCSQQTQGPQQTSFSGAVSDYTTPWQSLQSQPLAIHQCQHEHQHIGGVTRQHIPSWSHVVQSSAYSVHQQHRTTIGLHMQQYRAFQGSISSTHVGDLDLSLQQQQSAVAAGAAIAEADIASTACSQRPQLFQCDVSRSNESLASSSYQQASQSHLSDQENSPFCRNKTHEFSYGYNAYNILQDSSQGEPFEDNIIDNVDRTRLYNSSGRHERDKSHRHRKQQREKSRSAQQRHHADMRSPASWYPLARAMQRQLIAHVGATNSGKTHAALSALMAASSGVYCGPLRLLACEVADRLNAAGVPCNLVTGQEVRLLKGARHTACTVEMADLDRQVEVAVLDEIQMISDKSRGWSWTRALLGLPAQSIHLCGDPAAADLIAELAEHCSDALQVNSYRRLSPLIVEPRALGGVHAVEEGDCVVAFGRKALHKLRKSILATRKDANGEDFDCDAADVRHGVGMVYGALPPEARRSQAALFNAGADEWPRYSVMVASDAIGMGLNLNIRRVVFATMHKYDGEERRLLTPSEVKQIAGRAGRYGGAHAAAGYVTCLNQEDLPLLREALGTASSQNTHACLLPSFEQLELYQSSLKETIPFHRVLSKFSAAARLSGPYFLADMSNMVSLARVLRHLEDDMDTEDMYTWCISPAGADDPAVLQALLTFATLYVDDHRITPDCITTSISSPPRTPAEMKAAEELFRVYDLYLWLAGRMGPGVFQGQKQVRQQRQQVAELINFALQEMGGVLGHAARPAGHKGRVGREAMQSRGGGREERERVSSNMFSASEDECDEAEVVRG